MGQGPSVVMTQEDVDEVCEACGHVFDQREVQTLYWRFRALDKGKKGFVTADELLAIPELSINPLAPRLVRMLDGCNYRDFVRFLAAFSPRASSSSKAQFMFECYDVDGDGVVSAADLRSMLAFLVAGHMSEDQVEGLVNECMKEAGDAEGVTLDAFCKSVDVSRLEVTVATGW